MLKKDHSFFIHFENNGWFFFIDTNHWFSNLVRIQITQEKSYPHCEF